MHSPMIFLSVLNIIPDNSGNDTGRSKANNNPSEIHHDGVLNNQHLSNNL